MRKKTASKCCLIGLVFINYNGLIHARGKGTAKITAKVNGKTVKITVKVIE